LFSDKIKRYFDTLHYQVKKIISILLIAGLSIFCIMKVAIYVYDNYVPTKAYYPNGTLAYKYYTDEFGRHHGKFAQYHLNGKISKKGRYSYGEKTGTWKYYDEKGLFLKKTQIYKTRAGAICNDGWRSKSSGPGTCSWHGGVSEYVYKLEEREINR
jgi:hypothetical protein